MTALRKFINRTANQIFETQMRRAAQRIEIVCGAAPIR
jgi:hypothetical protein